MKKFFLSIFVLFIASFSLFAQSERKIVIIPLMEGEVSVKDAWTNDENAKIMNEVGAHFESNIFEYTNFDIVNNANKDQIIKIQREVETSGLYDESTIPEPGLFKGATHALYVNILHDLTGYTVTARLVEIYGENRTITAKPVTRATAEELSGIAGCAVDEITIDLCRKLGAEYSKTGVPLTAAQEHILMKGTFDLTADEKFAQFDNEVQLYSDQIDNFTREINSLTEDTAADALERQKNLEGLRELAKKNLEYVKEKQQRYEEEQKRIEDDRELDAKRTATQRERILDSSMVTAQNIARIRNGLGSQRSLLSQMNSIEYTKKVFVDLNEKAAYEKLLINDDAESDIEQKYLEIESRELMNSEKNAYGEITTAASKNREKEFNDYSSLRKAEASVATKDIDKLLMDQQEKLIKSINAGYKTIEKKTVNSITGELVVIFGPYDGERLGWDIYITVQSDNMVIFKTTSFIKYEAIAGKKPVTDIDTEGYQEFNGDIDYYVSMFSRGEPILTFEMDAYIVPSEKDRPSEYTFTFDNLCFYDTRDVKVNKKKISGRKKGTLEIEDNIAVVQLQPAYDIHTKKEIDAAAKEEAKRIAAETKEEARIIAAEAKAEQKQLARENDAIEKINKQREKEEEIHRKQLAEERKAMEARQAEEAKRIAKEEKKEAKREAVRQRPADKNYKHSLIAINCGYAFTDTTATSLGIELATGLLPFIYFDYKANVMNIDPDHTKYYPITDPKMNLVISNMFQLGLNIPMGGVLEVFASGGIGFNWYCPASLFKHSSFTSAMEEIPQSSFIDMTYGFTAGLHIEFVRHLALISSYNYTYIHEKNHGYHSVDAGLAFVF